MAETKHSVAGATGSQGKTSPSKSTRKLVARGPFAPGLRRISGEHLQYTSVLLPVAAIKLGAFSMIVRRPCSIIVERGYYSERIHTATTWFRSR